MVRPNPSTPRGAYQGVQGNQNLWRNKPTLPPVPLPQSPQPAADHRAQIDAYKNRMGDPSLPEPTASPLGTRFQRMARPAPVPMGGTLTPHIGSGMMIDPMGNRIR